MLFQGYRFHHQNTSYAVMHFGDDFDGQLIDRIPFWPSSIDDIDCEEIRENDITLMHDDQDVLLLIGADDQHTNDWEFLEDLAELSNARCKVLLCDNEKRFSDIKGFDVIISASDLSHTMNDLVWAIASTIYLGMNGIDEADIITVLLAGKSGHLKTYALSESQEGWEEAFNDSTKYLVDIHRRKKIAGIFIAVTLNNTLNYHNHVYQVIDRNRQLSDDLVNIAGGCNFDSYHRYQPKGIIELIMFE